MEETTMLNMEEAKEIAEVARWRFKNKVAAVLLALGMLTAIITCVVLLYGGYDIFICFLFFFCRIVSLTFVAGLINKWYIEVQELELPVTLVWCFIDCVSYSVELYLLGMFPW